ncbi:MAG: hypothetical protein ABI162_06445 [Luteolibacter sp.]
METVSHPFWKALFICSFVFLFSGCTEEEKGKIKSEISTEQFLEEVKDSQNQAKQWFLGSLRKEGLFTYQYNPETGSDSTGNNAIRQFMAARLLAEMVKENPELSEEHRKNLSFLMTNWYRETQDKQYGYTWFDEKSKLGANAMLLRTLVYSPFFEAYEAQAKKLADGIVSLIQQDGSLRPWFIEPNYAYDKDYLLTFYSGEAIVSLLEYAEKTESPEYLNHAKKAQEFYLDRYVNHLKENYYPAYVPWHTISLNKLYKITNEKKYADAIFTMNDILLVMQDTKKHVGRFYNAKTPQYGKPHAASDAVYTEGLAYAYEVAVLVGDKTREKKYLNALKLALRNLQSLQYTGNIPARYDSEKVRGGIQTRVGTTFIRIDNVQHTLDAYRKIQEVVKP